MSMRIVLISLERATERRRRMAEEFAQVGLDYKIWPAKDARTLTDEDRAFVDHAARERLGLHPIPDGSLACTLSERAAMQDLVINGPESMAVFEDDARFEAALPEVLQALERQTHVFDIVKLQRRNLRRPFIPTMSLPTGHRLGRVRFSDFGSEGYVITREAARLLLERIPRMVRDMDHELSYFWENGPSTSSTSIRRSCAKTGSTAPKYTRRGARSVWSIGANGSAGRPYWRGVSRQSLPTTCGAVLHSGGFCDQMGPIRSPARGRGLLRHLNQRSSKQLEHPFRQAMKHRVKDK